MSEFKLSTEHPFHLKSILGIDFGEKFIGLGLYCVNRDPYPTPYGRIQNTSFETVIKELTKVIDDEFIDNIVVGVPRLLDGKETSTTLKVRNFIRDLSDHFTLPIFEQDETLSTFEAESRMKSLPQYNFKVDLKKIDALSAAIILEDFIRRTKSESRL